MLVPHGYWRLLNRLDWMLEVEGGPRRAHSLHHSPSMTPPAGLVISLQLLRGDLEQVRRDHPLLFGKGVTITRKLGFPDVIMPGQREEPR